MRMFSFSSTCRSVALQAPTPTPRPRWPLYHLLSHCKRTSMNSQAETRLACSTKNEICSAQDHLALLPLNDLLPVWSLTLRRVRDLIGFEVESHGTDKYPLLLSPRSVSSPHPETKQRNCQVSHRSGRKRKRKEKEEAATVMEADVVSSCVRGGSVITLRMMLLKISLRPDLTRFLLPSSSSLPVKTCQHW